MNNIGEAQNEAAPRQPKYLDLMQIDNQLQEVIQHIMDINNKLGVMTPTQEPVDNAKTSNIESLVKVY